MPRAIPVELRERVVQAYENGEGSYTELAARFKIGRASVSRWLRRSREGHLEATSRRRPLPQRRVLTEEHLEFIRATLEAVPDSTAPELVAALKEEFDHQVSEATVKRWRRRLGFTRKRGAR